jgi:hypothetical protein
MRSGLIGITLCATSACASSNTADAARESQTGGGGQLVWTGSLQPTQERTGAAVPTKQQKAYGTVRLQPTSRDLNRTSVSIVISTPLQEPSELRWAIVPGRCGSGALPMVGHEHFPVLEVSSNGRGQLTTEIPFAMPYDGSYHVNVYRGTVQMENVLTCANLRRAGS